MRKRSEELLPFTIRILQIFPTFLFHNLSDQLEQNIQKLESLMNQYKNEILVTQIIKQKLYNFVYLCHHYQVSKIYRSFCIKNQIELPQLRISNFHPNNLLPNLQQVGIALSENRKFKFPHIQPIPEELFQTLNNIFLLNGYLPHYERLLLFFPTYLQKYMHLYDFLMEKQNFLDQTICYFLGISAAAEYGSTYMLKKLITRFLEIGGQQGWLNGNIPEKIRIILPLCHKLAYSPWDINVNDLKNLIGHGKNKWSLQQLIHACSIMIFHHMTATFALANGLNSETNQQFENLNLNKIDQVIRFRDVIQKVPNSSVKKIQQLIQNLATKSEKNIDKETQQRLSQTRQQQQHDYTKQINEQMKKLDIYEKIHSLLKNILPPYQKIQRRNEHTTSNIEYTQYNFQFFAYPYLNNLNEQLANKTISMVEYCKEMTNGNFGEYNINTTSFRRAIRYYVQNIAGYIHPQYNYKANMTNFLSKQLKFYIKLLMFQPFLMQKQVINHIPHQQNIIGYLDIIHISLLVINTKFEYTMMMLCKALQQLNQQ